MGHADPWPAGAVRRVRRLTHGRAGRGQPRLDRDEDIVAAALAELPAGAARIAERPTIVDLLMATGLVESRAAAHRTVGEGGAYVNNAKVLDAGWTASPDDLLHGRWLLVRRGKRNLAAVEVERTLRLTSSL